MLATCLRVTWSSPAKADCWRFLLIRFGLKSTVPKCRYSMVSTIRFTLVIHFGKRELPSSAFP